MKDSLETNEVLANTLPYAEIDIEPGLGLRQLNPNDAERLFALTDRDREYLQKWLPWPKHTRSVDDSRAFIEGTIEARKNGEKYGYGIEVDGSLLGHVSLMHLKDDQDPEIGYWIASEAAGKGVTTKVAVALTSFGFETLGLYKIIIRADPDNIGSNRVAEKAGYTFDRLRQDEDGPVNVWAVER